MKRRLKLKVHDTPAMVEMLKKLTTLDADLDAEGRFGSVSVTLYGTKEEIRRTLEKLREFAKPV
jgi:hypothetical protein